MQSVGWQFVSQHSRIFKCMVLVLSIKKEVSGTFPFICPLTAFPVSYSRHLNFCTALSTSPSDHPGLPAMTCIYSVLTATLLWKKKGTIPVNQAGFRKGSCTTGHLVKLTSHIKKQFSRRKSTLVTFFMLKWVMTVCGLLDYFILYVAAVSCGTSHASAVSTLLQCIFKKHAIKKQKTKTKNYSLM